MSRSYLNHLVFILRYELISVQAFGYKTRGSQYQNHDISVKYRFVGGQKNHSMVLGVSFRPHLSESRVQPQATVYGTHVAQNWQWNRFFSEYFGFYSVSTINLPTTYPQEHDFFFRSRQFPSDRTASNLDPSVSRFWKYKYSPLKTGFGYAQVPFRSGFTVRFHQYPILSLPITLYTLRNLQRR